MEKKFFNMSMPAMMLNILSAVIVALAIAQVVNASTASIPRTVSSVSRDGVSQTTASVSREGVSELERRSFGCLSSCGKSFDLHPLSLTVF